MFSPGLAGKSDTDEGPPIVRLRTVFLAFVYSVVLIAAVLAVVFPLSAPGSTHVSVYVLVTVAPLSLSAIPLMTGRLLGFCGGPVDLANAYTTILFVNIAFVEAAGVLGLVAAFIADALWPYLVGMAVALVGFVVIAPTRARIQRLDSRLSARGCDQSLRTGLFTRTDDRDK